MGSRNPPIAKSQPTNAFKPQTKKATQNTKSHSGKSQLSPRQKSQLKKLEQNKHTKNQKESPIINNQT
jgi:hypothetical protein